MSNQIVIPLVIDEAKALGRIKKALATINPIDNGRVITSEVLVSCCGCNEEVRITREEASEWTDTDWFMCHECE